jgi:hypothetical protein
MTRLQAGRLKGWAISVGQSSISGCEDQQRANQSVSLLANNTPLSGSKSAIHYITPLLYVFLSAREKYIYFLCFKRSQESVAQKEPRTFQEPVYLRAA